MVRSPLANVAVAVLVASAPLWLASDAGATTVRAAERGVEATLSYRGAYVETRDLRLRVEVDGVRRYDAAVAPASCAPNCEVWSFTRGAAPLHVVDLGAGERRDVVVDLYSGGAHCCTIVEVLTYHERRRSFTAVARDFGDPSARLVDLGHDGRFEFLSADDSFAYAFTDYAGSAMPVEVLALEHGRFVNVTRHYPAAIRANAAQMMADFRDEANQGYRDSVGIAAAWAADEEMLGRTTTVRRFLAAQAAAGHLNSALSPVEPSGRAFVRALLRFLRAHGY